MGRAQRGIVWVKGIAGLGNRIASICDAVAYAQEGGRAVWVDWSDRLMSDGQHNVFGEYFELHYCPVASPQEIQGYLEQARIYPAAYQGRLTTPHNDHFVQAWHPASRYLPAALAQGKLKGYWQAKAAHAPAQPASQTMATYLWGALQAHTFPMGQCLPPKLPHDVVVYADYTPPFRADIFRRVFRLTPELGRAIEKLRYAHRIESRVGLHVRASDKQPLHPHWIEAIQAKLSSLGLSDAPLFLSTDSDAVVKELTGVFKDVVCLRTAGLGEGPLHQWAERKGDTRVSSQVFREAVTDMWLLGACRTLLYQGNSAFTWASRAMHADPQRCVDWDGK